MKIGITVGVVCLALATSAGAQTRYEESSHSGPAGPFSLRTGIGFTSSPTTFLMGFEGDYEVVDQFSLGAHVQLGLSDDYTIVSPVFYGRYRIDLSGINPSLAPIEPSIRAGLGFTYWAKDLNNGHEDDDTQFLMSFGMGVEYRFTPNFAAGTLMHFNIIPTQVFDDRQYDDNFYWGWEVATLRYTF
jgi:outer membrane protein with beta-barrel domain